MDSELIGLVILAALGAILGLPIAALVVARTTARALRDEMSALNSRLRDLEAQVARLARQSAAPAPQFQPQAVTQAPLQATPAPHSAQPSAAPAPEPAPSPAASAAGQAPPIPEAKTAAAPGRVPFEPLQEPTAPLFTLTESAPARSGDARSLESRIGSQWFNRVGILAVLIAAAWFLKLAFDNHWIGPLGRVLIGLLAGAGLIAWSERFEKRGYTAFAYSLKAIGSGTLYLSLWAAFSLYALMPAWAAFAAMVAVTAFNGIVSWARNAELLALYAIAGGLSTPLLVSTGGNHEITLLTYLLILNLAVLVLVALRPWSRLLFAAFGGTVFFFIAWWNEFYSYDQAGRTAIFLTCFFLLYALAPRLIRADLDQRGDPSGWDFLALVILPIANAALGFIAYYALLPPATANWADPWLAVAFAAFYLLLLRLPARGVLRPSSPLLASLHLSAAVVFLTLAIPLKTRGRWLTIGWLTEGAALLWVSRRERQLLIRAFALICLLLGIFALLVLNPPASTTPIFNQRFAAYVFAIAIFAFVVWLAHTATDTRDSAGGWRFLAGAAILVINALILIAGSLEIQNYWWARREIWVRNWRSEYFTLWQNYTMYARFSYSAFFMAFGAALLAVGFWRRSAFLRWQALVLLAVTIAEVFLVDTSELSQGFRILSFLGLGVLLLVVSFVYQKDWLNLRGQPGDRAS
jgi:uncharacterized membrane protein